MIETPGGYEPREATDHGILTVDGWQLKQYSITRGDPISPDLLVTTERHVRSQLPNPPATDTRYGVGFLIIHAAADGIYLLVDWWTRENMLQHRVFTAPRSSPSQFTRSIDGPAMCVWELKLLDFEREAWIETVLAPATEASIQSYLERRYNGPL